jgi:hypothetical protein
MAAGMAAPFSVLLDQQYSILRAEALGERMWDGQDG